MRVRFRFELPLLFLGTSVAIPVEAQEPPRPFGRRVAATGTFSGTVKGDSTWTLVNGDIVTERIDCRIELTFHPDGTVSYNASDYFYEKIYQKRTTTGGDQVGRTVVRAMGSSGSRGSRLLLVVTQYDDVWNATWQPVDLPSEVLYEAWLTDGRGRTWGHSTPIRTNPLFSCQPKILWRGKSGRGAGLPLQGSYDGPDVNRPWARVTANWSFQVRTGR